MKHVVVTGGAKGIGKATVEELAANGYKVTATYHHSKDEAEKVAAKYPNVTYEAVNLEDRTQLEAFIKKLAKDPIDVLVNNAGIYLGKPFEDMTQSEVYQQLDLNLTAPTRLTHGLLSALKKTKSPLVINVSSQAVHAKLTGEALYSAVKTALTTLSEILRAELNPKGIRVVVMEPYAVNTYGIPEPSDMILPEELAKIIRYAIEAPDHLQLDTIGVSHIKQSRPDYPDWIEK